MLNELKIDGFLSFLKRIVPKFKKIIVRRLLKVIPNFNSIQISELCSEIPQWIMTVLGQISKSQKLKK